MGDKTGGQQPHPEEMDRQVDRVRTNVFEDVSADERAHHIIVSTNGDVISARRVTAKTESAQWLGQMSDATVQQLSRDRASSNIADQGTEEAQEPVAARFKDSYGVLLNRIHT
jgi:hypothetical protein